MAIDPAAFRAVMGHFATGVTVISYLRDGERAGMTVNAFLSVSLEPPLVLVSVRRLAQFTAHVKNGDCYGVNFLAERQQHLSAHFSGQPVPGLQVPFIEGRHGTPLIDGSLSQIVARVVDIHPAGDHLLYIAQVEQLRVGAEARPLIFFSGAYKRINAHEPGVQWRSNEGW